MICRALDAADWRDVLNRSKQSGIGLRVSAVMHMWLGCLVMWYGCYERLAWLCEGCEVLNRSEESGI